MNIKTLQTEMKKLQDVYLGKFPLTNDLVKIWFEQFKDCRDDWFSESVKEYIASSKYPPVPAEIWELYHKRESKQMDRVVELEKIYNRLCTRYPGGAQAGDECRVEFRRLTYGKSLDEAGNILNEAEGVIFDMENGEGYISLLDFLKGL